MIASAKQAVHELPFDESLARQRQEHLCLRCTHRQVCKIAAAADPCLVVVISQCLAFERAEPAASPAKRGIG